MIRQNTKSPHSIFRSIFRGELSRSCIYLHHMWAKIYPQLLIDFVSVCEACTFVQWLVFHSKKNTSSMVLVKNCKKIGAWKILQVERPRILTKSCICFAAVIVEPFTMNRRFLRNCYVIAQTLSGKIFKFKEITISSCKRDAFLNVW